MKYTPLGHKSDYTARYSADILCPVPRGPKRKEIGLNPNKLPFFGIDIWNHYEVSWLNDKGKPMQALAEIVYDCNSPNIVESKSLKLYFNSLNNENFSATTTVEKSIKQDLEKVIEAPCQVALQPLTTDYPRKKQFDGVCIDTQDIECTEYSVKPAFLSTGSEELEETLFSDLLKSNCLITNQPDWASVQIQYKGKKIDPEGLLRYIVSFRNHNEFHEQCVERIFTDIMHYCAPEELTVYARYTRRGGIDINPYRSTKKALPPALNTRLLRQ